MATRSETLLVILGAGASYDCIDVRSPHLRDLRTGRKILDLPGLPSLTFDQARPPLTQDLVQPSPLTNWALDRWPKARPVVGMLQASLKRKSGGPARVLTLEQALAAYADDVSTRPERKTHLLAMSFYLRDVLWASTTFMMSPLVTSGITNHLALVNHLLDWSRAGRHEVVFVSFNYDLLLERAFESTWRFEPWRIESYLEHEKISLLKPHGSVQWAWPMRSPRLSSVFASALGAGNAAVNDSGPIDRSEPTSVGSATFEDEGSTARDLVVPAMALPVTGKADFCWPAAQGRRLTDLEGRVTRVLTIGWRGIEDHFTSLARAAMDPAARGLVVNGGPSGHDEALDAAHRLAQATGLGRNRWDTFGEGFSTFVDDRANLDRFLARTI